MGAIVVVVADIFGNQPSQMTFIQGNDVIQQIVAATADPTLRHAVLPRTFEGSPHRNHPQRSNGGRHLQTIFRIPVEDQKPGSRPKWKRFSQLLNDPQAGRLPGDVDVQDSSTIVTYDEEAVQHTEAHGWNREEIHRGDGFPMIAKEDQPTFGWLGIPRSSFHPTGDRPLGKIEPQHEELTVDARRAPCWVLSNHPEDQLSNLLRCLFSPNFLPDFRNQLPIQAESGPVPPDDRFRSDDNEVLLPAGPNSASNYPEELIKQTEDRRRTAPFQHSELLPKREIFQDEMPTATKHASKRSEQGKDQIEHGTELYQNRGRTQ